MQDKKYQWRLWPTIVKDIKSNVIDDVNYELQANINGWEHPEPKNQISQRHTRSLIFG